MSSKDLQSQPQKNQIQEQKVSKKLPPLGRGGSGFTNIGGMKFALIGGSSRKQHFDDIWVLELIQSQEQMPSIQWERVKFNSKNSDNQEFLARNSHSCFYSKSLDTVQLFGGSKLLDHYNDIYELKIHKEAGQSGQENKETRYIYDSVVRNQLSQNLKVVTGEWPLKRASFASSQTPQGFIIHGGANSVDGPLDDCLQYSFSDSTWKRLLTEGKPDSRQMHSCSYYAQSDSIFIFGGRVAKKAQISDQIFELDLKNQKWNKLENSMPRASCAHATVALSSQIILFYGGTNGGIPFYDDFLLFNMKTLKWRIVDFDKLKKVKYFGDDQPARQRIQAMCAVDEMKKYLVVFGGAGLEKEYNDVSIFSVQELLDESNSDEIDKIA